MAANDWRWKRTFYLHNMDDSAFLGIKSTDADKWGNADKSNRTPYFYAEDGTPDTAGKTLTEGTGTGLASTTHKGCKNNAGDSSAGTGSGATFNMTINGANTITALAINNGGSGYEVHDRILIPHTTSFGGGTLGSAIQTGDVDFKVSAVDGSGAITGIQRKWSHDEKEKLLQVLTAFGGKTTAQKAFPLVTFSSTSDADTKLGLDGSVYAWAECSAVNKTLVDGGKGMTIEMTFASESAQNTFKTRVDDHSGDHGNSGARFENDVVDH